jgi:hypothetical protein
MQLPIRRSRALYLLLAAGTIVLGLATRRFRGVLPDIVGAYAGDVLWAVMVYLPIAAIWHRAAPRRVAAGAAVVALAVELSQLYHAPWIDAVRQTRIGGLVPGFGFLWSDLACCAAGIARAAALDRRLTRRASASGPQSAPPPLTCRIEPSAIMSESGRCVLAMPRTFPRPS